ncbi:MAG: hypothetical protein HZB95_07140 [Nitrosomonadales bacterium]|nr:hypothetical protein [Nitrosomonadales bacterium]
MTIGTKIIESVSNGLARVALRLRGRRAVILHNHLFKNAGSSIDWALQNGFGEAFVDHRDDAQMRKGAAYLGPYLVENCKIQALSSHHLTLPLPEIQGVKLLRMMMFRHPIERVTSVYTFERAQVSDTHPGVIHAQKYSLRDYILWRMKPEVGPTIRNFQARKMLPPRKLGQEEFSEDEMSYLKGELQSIEMLGLVERFDESMVLFEECLRKVFAGVDLSYVAQNVGQDTSLKQANRLEKLKADIGDETYDLLIEHNRSDLRLFALAEAEVAARIARVRDFDEKLADFRARCKARAQAAA